MPAMHGLLQRVRDGRGQPADLELLRELGDTIRRTSRCGLGQTAPNPILTSLEGLATEYEMKLASGEHGMRGGFDLDAALQPARAVPGRAPSHL
jgi:NADH:ubiquinone oxidoreductase subunit F (NADH-binding)